MHVLPASANDCILQTNSFGLVNRHIFRPIDRNADSLIRDSVCCVNISNNLEIEGKKFKV